MSSRPPPYKCQRCDLVNPMGTTTCGACGASLTGAAALPVNRHPPHPGVQQTQQPQTTPAQTRPAQVPARNAGTLSQPGASSIHSVLPLFGWTVLTGRVINSDPIFMEKPDAKWGLFLLKIILLGILLYYCARAVALFVLVLVIFTWLVCKILSLIFPQALVTGVATQIIGFLLTRRLIGAPAIIPVRDIRLRDASGQEFLVRIKGQLRLGSIAAGDEIIAKGWMRRGTLRFRRGFNKRINAAIRIKVA